MCTGLDTVHLACVLYFYTFYDYKVVGGDPQIDCVLRKLRTYVKDHV